MKKIINENDFIREFEQYDRLNQFEVDGLTALFNYFEQYEEETGNEIEIDVIAICCEYVRYENIEEYNKDYNKEYETIEEIEETSVIMINENAFIIQSY